jgi:hypothetical protein
MAGQLLTWKISTRYRAEGAPMPNATPRCPHCGYALVHGQCPIPCKGKPLADDPRHQVIVCDSDGYVVAVQPITLYWTPKAA